MTKSNKFITGFLGISFFMFGILKSVHPFKGLYMAQITLSEMPFPSYWLGQIAEITIGLSLLLALAFRKKLSLLNLKRILYFGSGALVVMMLVVFYVHIHPNVPAEVLPLKIKPPYLPGMFFALALLNIYLTKKALQQNLRSE